MPQEKLIRILTYIPTSIDDLDQAQPRVSHHAGTQWGNFGKRKVDTPRFLTRSQKFGLTDATLEASAGHGKIVPS